MRLDKFLKISRIIKRRTIANEACDAEKVNVNGKTARASYEVKIGDIVEVNTGKTKLKFKIKTIAETVRKEAAAEMYEIIF